MLSLTTFQEEYAEDYGCDQKADVEPEIVLFLFHSYYLNRLLLFFPTNLLMVSLVE